MGASGKLDCLKEHSRDTMPIGSANKPRRGHHAEDFWSMPVSGASTEHFSNGHTIGLSTQRGSVQGQVSRLAKKEAYRRVCEDTRNAHRVMR
jgi:hypothetical protein